MGVTIGISERHGRPTPVSLSNKDRRQHIYTIGQTGTGKTTFLHNVILQDIENGEGVGLLDPHGDLAEAILDRIPPHRTNDVIYINPADLEWPIGINPIGKTHPDLHHLVVLNTISTLRGLWSDVWGMGRMQYILQNTLAALLHYDHATLLAVNRMLSDEGFRKKVLTSVKDPVVLAFWRDEFGAWDKRLRAEAVAPIQNKVGQFATTAPMRNILGQTRNAVDFRRAMDERKIVIVNLSKGKMGEDNSRLIGSFLVAQFQLAAMSRADIPEEERKDFFLYIDEFQNFANSQSLESILSEARKYRLCLTIAHQYTEQLGALKPAVFGNVGTMIAFRVGFEDAREIATQFHPIAPETFCGLDPYTVWMKILKGGIVSDPFFMKMHPPMEASSGRRELLIELSRKRFGTRREVVEERITRWLAH